MDECHYLDTSKMINFDVDKISCEVDAVSTYDDSPITYVNLSPTNKEWKITDALQSKLRVYLKSPCSHGHFYPPPSYWNIQKAFMEESGLIIRQSSVPYAHGKKSKAGSSFADARGNGMFCGRQGICQGTQLVFMGLIYHGKFDLHAMKDLWTDRNKNDINIFHRSPQADFEGHILEVEDNLFILGHPGCATSMFNQNPHDVLNHCEIKDNSSAIIEFCAPGFSFTEMYLLYDGKIKMNKRPIVSIVPVSLFVAGQPAKSLFQRNEKTPFHILQAETTKLPGGKIRNLLLLVLLLLPLLLCKQRSNRLIHHRKSPPTLVVFRIPPTLVGFHLPRALSTPPHHHLLPPPPPHHLLPPTHPPHPPHPH